MEFRSIYYFKDFPGSDKYKIEDELYDLAQDPGEDRNVSSDPVNGEVIAELSERMDVFLANYSISKYNLWDGGMAITHHFLFHYVEGTNSSEKCCLYLCLPAT